MALFNRSHVFLVFTLNQWDDMDEFFCDISFESDIKLAVVYPGFYPKLNQISAGHSQ